MGQALKILIADDHVLFREGLLLLLARERPDMTAVAVGSLGEAADQLAAGEVYDVVLIDLRMPDADGLADIVALKRRFPTTRIAVISGLGGRAEILEALREGLDGFLPKTLSGAALMNALQLIASGEPYFPASSFVQAEAAPESPGGLTAREGAVLERLGRGESNKEVGRALGIEETTVKLHVRAVCAKLGAKNRTDAVIRGMALGLI